MNDVFLFVLVANNSNQHNIITLIFPHPASQLVSLSGGLLWSGGHTPPHLTLFQTSFVQTSFTFHHEQKMNKASSTAKKSEVKATPPDKKAYSKSTQSAAALPKPVEFDHDKVHADRRRMMEEV